MEKLYCTIFLVDVSQNPEEVETVSSRIVQLIEDHGGVIKLNNPWGKRRLAFPLEGRTSAFYFEIEFTASSHLNIPSIIEKEYRLNDRVLRYLTYVVTKEELEQRRLSERRGRSSAASNDDRRPSSRSDRDAPPKAAAKEEKAAPPKTAAKEEEVAPDAPVKEEKTVEEPKVETPVVEEQAKETVTEAKPVEEAVTESDPETEAPTTEKE